MGLNVDLTKMLGILPKVSCPKCMKTTPTMFKDYDIECGNANPSPGKWQLMAHCHKCHHEFIMVFQTNTILVKSS